MECQQGEIITAPFEPWIFFLEAYPTNYWDFHVDLPQLDFVMVSPWFRGLVGFFLGFP